MKDSTLCGILQQLCVPNKKKEGAPALIFPRRRSLRSLRHGKQASLFPDSFWALTRLWQFPRGLLSLGENPRGNCIKAGFNSREKLATSKEDTMENLEVEIITATKVADEDRLNFWLRHVGMTKMLSFERHVFCWMERLCPHYDGGFWEFYDLSNGGFYIALAGEKKMWLTWPGNYFNDEMSADAAGIVATLYALNDFAEQISPAFGEKHRQLYDYIESHPEAQAIYAAID